MGRKGFRVVLLILTPPPDEVLFGVPNSPTVWAFDMMVQMYGALFLMAGAYIGARCARARRRFISPFSSAVASSYRFVSLYTILFPG